MSLNRTAVTARIKTLLEANTTPVFYVQAGEPLALGPDGGPWACFWYMGEGVPPEGEMTWGNVMLYERFQVMCYWVRYVELGTFEDLEAEIWSANRSLKAAFRGDSTLNALCADLDITDSEVDYGGFPAMSQPNYFRTLGFELHVRDLEAEAIAP